MVQVKMNLAGLNQIMRSDAVQKIVNAEAERIASAAGPDFEAVARPHRWVARAYVQPRNARGMREQAKNAALERALGTR